MADLLSVVPALKLKLYIVAPENRKEKVMDEIVRPTFRKIGISDYCKYIAIEDLNNLYTRVEGLKGHIQTSIIDTIAIEAEDGIENEYEY